MDEGREVEMQMVHLSIVRSMLVVRLCRECHRRHLACRSASSDGEYRSSAGRLALEYNNSLLALQQYSVE